MKDKDKDMIPASLVGPAEHNQYLSHFIVLVVAGLFALSLLRIGTDQDHFQWDLRVFHAAPAILEDGRNPYDREAGVEIPAGLSYLYPPVVLHVFAPVSRLSYEAAYRLWFVLKLLALIALIVVWRRAFEKVDASWLVLLLMTFGFNSALLRDFAAGNVALFEQLGLWIAFYHLLHRRPYIAGAVIAVVAQVKMMPVVFLGLLLAMPAESRWKPFSASLALFLALFATNFTLMPQLSMQYLELFVAGNQNLDERGVFNPSVLSLVRDLAEFAAERGVSLPASFANVAYFSYVTAFGLFLIWVLRRYWHELGKVDGRLLIYLACLIYVLTMPRVKDYTYIILLMPALHILRGLRPGSLIPLIAVLMVMPASSTYVPGLARHAIAWVHSYLSLFAAVAMFGILAHAVFVSLSANRGIFRGDSRVATSQ